MSKLSALSLLDLAGGECGAARCAERFQLPCGCSVQPGWHVQLLWDGGHQLPDGRHAASVYGQLRDFINCKESQLPAAAEVRDASEIAAPERCHAVFELSIVPWSELTRSRSSTEQPAEAEAEALPANNSDVVSAVDQTISEAQVNLARAACYV